MVSNLPSFISLRWIRLHVNVEFSVEQNVSIDVLCVLKEIILGASGKGAYCQS